MKNFILFCTCLISILEPIEAVETVHEKLQMEHKIAIDVSRQFQKGLLSKEQALDILINTFTDYSHLEGKLATFTEFVGKTVGIESPIFIGSPEQRGWSGSEVYAVQSEHTSEVQFFLKIFPFDSKNYLPEIFGLALMNEFSGVDSPKIYVCGQCMINGNRYFLILESPVKGISIQQYFIQVGQHELGTKARSLIFDELCEALQACGLGLARFHQYLPSKNQSLPKDAEYAMKLDLLGAIEELIHRPQEGIEIETLQAYAEHVLQKMKEEDHLIGLTYDDIKTIHTFYDYETKRTSLVNPQRIYLSLDQEGEVQGLPVKDVCKYLLSLKLNRFQYYLNEDQTVFCQEILTEEELKIATNAFELGYVQGGGILPGAIEKEYAFLQHDLFFIKNSRRDLPEPESTRVKDIVNISLENIRIQLNQKH